MVEMLPSYIDCDSDYTKGAFSDIMSERKELYIDNYEKKVMWETASLETKKTRKIHSKLEIIEKKFDTIKRQLEEMKIQFEKQLTFEDKFHEKFHDFDFESMLNDDEEWEEFELFED